MDPTAAFYEILIRHKFQRGAVLRELRERMIVGEDEVAQISTMTYDENEEDLGPIQEALDRIKIARTNNYYFIKCQNGQLSSGKFSSDGLFMRAAPTLELEVLKLWNSDGYELFSHEGERAIPVRNFYVWFFERHVAFHRVNHAGVPLRILDDDYSLEEFNREYFKRRSWNVTIMTISKSEDQENLWYTYDMNFIRTGFLLYPEEEEEEEFEVLPDEEVELPAMDCRRLIRNEGFYRAIYPVLPPIAINANYPENMIEIGDAAYVDDPRPLNSFDEVDQTVLIMAPFEDGQIWRGSYFTKDELRNWITNANHIVHRCEGRQFPYYREDLVAIYYLRLVIAGVTYYVPYIDILEFCQNDNPLRYLLEPTEYQITNIVSLSVMITSNVASSQHCTDSSPKRIYRLRPCEIRG